MKNYLKKFYDFACLCAYVLGTIGGLGWTLYNHGWAIAVGLVATSAMAFPYVKERFKDLINN